MSAAATRRFAAFALLGLLLAGCATSEPRPSSGLPMILENLQANPQQRQSAEVTCQTSLEDKPGDFPYEAFIAGFLDVPESRATRAFCAAMIEAVVSGDLTESDLRGLRGALTSDGKEPLGTLMRKLLQAYERLRGQQVERPATLIPAPAS